MSNSINTMLTALLASFLFAPLTADSQLSVSCKAGMHNGGLSIVLELQNSGETRIFIPISCWDIDGITSPDQTMLSYPETTYIVNGITYHPEGLKDLKSRTARGNYPDFRVLPKLLPIDPRQKRCITVKYPRNYLKDRLSGVELTVRVVFTTDPQWSQIKRLAGSRADAAISKQSGTVQVVLGPPTELGETRVGCSSNSQVKVNPRHREALRRAFNGRAFCTASLGSQ